MTEVPSRTRTPSGSVMAAGALAVGCVVLGGLLPAAAASSPPRHPHGMVAISRPANAAISTGRTGSGWSQSGGNPAGTNSTTATGVTPGNVSHLRREWRRHVPEPSTQLTMGDGRLINIVTGTQSVVTARRLSSGHVLWRSALPTADSPSNPVYINGTVYVDYTDGAATFVEALNARNGHRLWRRRFNDGEPNGMSVSPPAVNRVLVAMNSKFAALSATTGHLKWARNTFGANPVYGHGSFYVESFSGLGHAYRATNGHELRSLATEDAGPPAVSGKNLIASTFPGDGVEDLPATPCHHRICQPRWTHETSKPTSPVAVAHGRIATMTSGPPDHLLILRERDGHLDASVRIPGGASSPTIAGRVVFFTNYLKGDIDAYSLDHPRHRVWRHQVSKGRALPTGTLVAIYHERIAAIVNDELIVYRLR
jgi:outer membrane protein assembly factor BamB